MAEEVKEQEGHILLYFGQPPRNLGRIEFVVVVAHQCGQILYTRWREDGCWVLPSGRVVEGEASERAACRELLEETGATLKQIQVLCYMQCFMFHREYWGIAYLGEIDKMNTPTDSNEVIEASLFKDVPVKLSGRFEGQVRALHRAAYARLHHTGS